MVLPRPVQSAGALTSISFCYTNELVDDLNSIDGVLAVINFGDDCYIDSPPGHIHCGVPLLGSPSIKEVWRTDLPIRRGSDGLLFWSETDEVLVAGLSIDEAQYPEFKMAITTAYQRILQFIADKGCPHIIRVWNYIGGINRGSGESERYKQFCYGRYQAMVGMGYAREQFPSACALGHAGRGGVIYLIATKNPGVNFENPKQMSAYHYPSAYGPRSPSFARATLAEWKSQRQLFLSGTASILGHQSMYFNNIDAQFELTCQNIDFLLKHVAEQLGESRKLEMSALKVYLRDKAYFDLIEKRVYNHFGDEIPVVFLLADICRKELLVEIDGLCML